MKLKLTKYEARCLRRVLVQVRTEEELAQPIINKIDVGLAKYEHVWLLWEDPHSMVGVVADEVEAKHWVAVGTGRRVTRHTVQKDA